MGQIARAKLATKRFYDIRVEDGVDKDLEGWYVQLNRSRFGPGNSWYVKVDQTGKRLPEGYSETKGPEYEEGYHSDYYAQQTYRKHTPANDGWVIRVSDPDPWTNDGSLRSLRKLVEVEASMFGLPAVEKKVELVKLKSLEIGRHTTGYRFHSKDTVPGSEHEIYYDAATHGNVVRANEADLIAIAELERLEIETGIKL